MRVMGALAGMALAACGGPPFAPVAECQVQGATFKLESKLTSCGYYEGLVSAAQWALTGQRFMDSAQVASTLGGLTIWIHSDPMRITCDGLNAGESGCTQDGGRSMELTAPGGNLLHELLHAWSLQTGGSAHDNEYHVDWGTNGAKPGAEVYQTGLAGYGGLYPATAMVGSWLDIGSRFQVGWVATWQAAYGSR